MTVITLTNTPWLAYHVMSESHDSKVTQMYKSVGSSAAQAQEECMPALFALHRVVFIIEVQDVLLCLEAELLVEQHGRVARRYVKGHILPHAGLQREEKKIPVSTEAC